MALKSAVSKISIAEIFARFETFLFDADGVLWTGNVPVPGAIEFLDKLLADQSKKVFILTNNGTRTIDQYTEKIRKVGFGSIQRENIISSALVLGEYLKGNPGKYQGREVYLVGTENLKNTLEQAAGVKCFGIGSDNTVDYLGTELVGDLDIDLSHDPVAVVCSADLHFSYPKIMKAVNYLSRPGVEFLVTNEDLSFPTQRKGVVVPGSGAMSVCIRAVSGREPTVFGKPAKPMADLLKSRGDLDPEKTIMFGDRLDTDIAFANANGFSSCLMLTGVNNLEDVDRAAEKGQNHLIPTFTSSFV